MRRETGLLNDVMPVISDNINVGGDPQEHMTTGCPRSWTQATECSSLLFWECMCCGPFFQWEPFPNTRLERAMCC